jgi:hypothetical protein
MNDDLADFRSTWLFIEIGQVTRRYDGLQIGSAHTPMRLARDSPTTKGVPRCQGCDVPAGFSDRIALKGKLDRLAGQRLGLAVEQSLGRHGCPVPGAGQPAGRVARNAWRKWPIPNPFRRCNCNGTAAVSRFEGALAHGWLLLMLLDSVASLIRAPPAKEAQAQLDELVS